MVVYTQFVGYSDFVTENLQNNTPADTVYKWTVRGIYTAVLLLNFWYVSESYKGTPQGEQITGKIEKLKARIIRPWNERKRFRRQANETIFEAWQVVDEAAKGNQ